VVSDAPVLPTVAPTRRRKGKQSLPEVIEEDEEETGQDMDDLEPAAPTEEAKNIAGEANPSETETGEADKMPTASQRLFEPSSNKGRTAAKTCKRPV
jgi:hypothetical protein